MCPCAQAYSFPFPAVLCPHFGTTTVLGIYTSVMLPCSVYSLICFRRIVTGATGGTVLFTILVTAVYMIIRSIKENHRLKRVR